MCWKEAFDGAFSKYQQSSCHSTVVRVADDTQIWSDIYDKVINDVFQVQSEIAQNVITQLGITLLEPQKANVNRSANSKCGSLSILLARPGTRYFAIL